MNTQTETISPVKVLLEQLARVSKWVEHRVQVSFFLVKSNFRKKVITTKSSNIP